MGVGGRRDRRRRKISEPGGDNHTTLHTLTYETVKERFNNSCQKLGTGFFPLKTYLHRGLPMKDGNFRIKVRGQQRPRSPAMKGKR